MNAAMAAERRRQLDAFQIAFGHLGYNRDCIRYDWSYSKPTASNEHPAIRGKLDAALFHDPREHDYSTIAFAVELGRQDLVRHKTQGEVRARELFERTVAPHVVLGGSTTIDVWMNCHGTPTPILDVALQSEAMIQALDQHRSKLERAALARLRGGQGVLFDRLYEARREELAASLNEGFSSALKSHPAWRKDDRRALLSRAAIALLAARILEDKSFLASAAPYTDARRLLDAVEAKADGFFSEVCKDLDRLTKELGRAVIDAAVQPIMAHLTGPISFSLVTPEMLGHLYESALIPQRTGRTSSGGRPEGNWIHYTPHTLTRHILRRLPMEELRQDQRRVLDMACGSGSFLLAGSERLADLYDAHEDTVEASRLAHLQSRVIGYDTDEIALLVTRLTYLLAHWTRSATMDDLPEPTCAKRDAMSLTPAGFAGGRPTVIVGNPPFASGRTQLANRFLAKAIELLAPGGLLGMILPLGFLKMTREQCPAARRELLGACDLLEVWELPKHAVGLQADQETCVVLARRHGGAARSVSATLFKQTYSKAGAAVGAVRDDLRSARTFAASGLPGHPERPWSMDPYARIIASPLEATWRRMNGNPTVEAICEGCTGLDMVGAGARFSGEPGGGMVPYMRHQSQLRPYYVLPSDWRRGVDSPDARYNYADPSTARFQRREHWPLLRGAKVVATARGSRDQRTQFVAAYDPALAPSGGLFPEDDFVCLGIRPDLSPWAKDFVERYGPHAILMWLSAILNSPPAQAWIAMRAATRGYGVEDLKSLPLPRFDPEIPRLIEQLMKLPPEARSSNRACWELTKSTEPSETAASFEELAGYINHRIALSYGLNEDDVFDLHSYLRETTEQWVDAPAEAHLPRPGRYRRISGSVAAIDTLRQEVSLDLYRYCPEGPITVPLPRHLPGWALTPGVEFTCAVPAESVSAEDLRDPWLLRDFRPVPYSYMDVNELERLIGYERPKEHAHVE